MEMIDDSSHHPHRVPSGTRVYAIGDIHGRLDLLDELLARVCDDAGESPASRVVVVFLGDLIDRGAQSCAVVERVIDGAPAQGPLAGARYVCLRGNHEDTMLQFLADFSVGPRWFRNGGLEAIRSYVGEVDSRLALDYPRLQKMLYRALPTHHLRFLSSIPTWHEEGDYLFVHAGVRPGVPLDRQDPFDLMWIREPFLGATETLGKMVVHGHTVVAEPEMRPHRIGIDTGAYRTGRLTALVLEEDRQRFLST
ncbi:serine/threonine protein phosphatase [Paramagnetospirillum magnetotacticum MS-1]|uniref:Serine/threonine protein phosphatase n=2 Tax=Paramagnetospirillum magnetotacticum TaxID=188 RepID=A0A0C2YVQ4_PARME|nr:serine/threonine protein phosphatase [Paramagnetospirillum magnetotacticum MS-1]